MDLMVIKCIISYISLSFFCTILVTLTMYKEKLPEMARKKKIDEFIIDEFKNDDGMFLFFFLASPALLLSDGMLYAFSKFLSIISNLV